MLQPLYLPHTCTSAYQLRWSLALYAKQRLPDTSEWFEPLQQVTEIDDVRVLEHAHQRGGTHLFLVSTKPHVAPPDIVRSVKGRLQYLVRMSLPKCFRRNYSLTSVGDVNSRDLETYLARQPIHHLMADPHVQARIERYQLHRPDVDLSRPQFSSYGRYRYNLHVVVKWTPDQIDLGEESLARTYSALGAIADRRGHRLSRAAILSDHVHLTLGAPYLVCPESVALTYMNNLAYFHGMRPILRPSYYVGTFGDYDMDAVR